MWWLRRMTTLAMPYRRARGTAVSMARAVSQTPGRRRPSQVRQGPVSRTISGSPALRHGAGRELVQIAGQQGQPVGGVAHEIGLDQELADQAGAVGLDPRGGEEPGGEVDQGGGLVA